MCQLNFLFFIIHNNIIIFYILKGVIPTNIQMGACSCFKTAKYYPNAVLPVKTHHAGVHQLKQNYMINDNTKVLGAGAYGKVFMSYNLAEPDFKVAIKVINKEKVGADLDAIRAEIKILTTLDHPN